MHNKIILNIIFLCLSFVSFAHAKIIETDHFEDILSEIDQNTLVLIDIDDTLINTTSMLGNTSWWNYFVSKILNAHLPLEKVRPQINEVIQKILQRIPMELVETDSADIIKKLQLQGTLALALTGRSRKSDYIKDADLCTHEHLAQVGIDFTQTAIPKHMKDKVCHFFSYGIIFTDYQDKGPFLKDFIGTMGFYPEKIVFIDDQLNQIKSVENAMASLRIPTVGFRYGRLDNLHKQFDPLLVNIQLEALIRKDWVLSDEEALKIAQENQNLSNDYFLNELIQEIVSN